MIRNKDIGKKYLYIAGVLVLSLSAILFTQWVQIWRDPVNAMPINWMTILGLFFLGLFSMIGVFIGDLSKRTNIGFIQTFPILGWVSLVSIVVCLFSDLAVEAILSVNFLSITTPILAFAGISVANQLTGLLKTSWKILIVAIFVFSGTYIGSSILAHIGLLISG